MGSDGGIGVTNVFITDFSFFLDWGREGGIHVLRDVMGINKLLVLCRADAGVEHAGFFAGIAGQCVKLRREFIVGTECRT